MGLFGFSSKKEVEEKEQLAKQQGAAQLAHQQQTSLGNLSKGSQFTYSIPWFDVFDLRLPELPVPVAVKVTVVYAIEDIPLFNSMNKTEGMSDGVFQDKMKSSITKYIKGCITNVPEDCGIPLVQMERKVVEISDYVGSKVAPQVERVFAIKVRALDVESIRVDDESKGYQELKSLTAAFDSEKRRAMHAMEMDQLNNQRSDINLQHKTNQSNFILQNDLQQSNLRLNTDLQQKQAVAQTSLGIDAMKRQQEMNLGGQEEMLRMQQESMRIDLENKRETQRIQREEMQRASKLQTEQTFLGAHQANLNSNLLNNGLDNGINVFQQQAAPQMGAMPQMPGMPGMGAKTAPVTPMVSYMLAVNNQQAGPFNWDQLKQLVQQGQFTQQTYVWKQGMANWDMAGNIQELAPLFQGAAPQMPGFPPVPGM